jgi:hypothetical protein
VGGASACMGGGDEGAGLGVAGHPARVPGLPRVRSGLMHLIEGPGDVAPFCSCLRLPCYTQSCKALLAAAAAAIQQHALPGQPQGRECQCRAPHQPNQRM